MSQIWNKIIDFSQFIELKFQVTGEKILDKEHKYNWYNAIYTSNKYRRAHIEIVDNRQTHKIYILHCTIFAHYNDPSPIWGFDVVCGANKITGAFHDFSWAGSNDHFMMDWFSKNTKNLIWNKPRELPNWAKQIFSKSMIAVSNLQDNYEIDQLLDISKKSLEYYLQNVGISQESGSDYHMAQDRYCDYQQQNPHVINSMISMGIPREVMQDFVKEILFPKSN